MLQEDYSTFTDIFTIIMRQKPSLLRWFVSDFSLLSLSLIHVASSKLKAGCNTESKYVSSCTTIVREREHRQCLHISPSSVMLPIRPRRVTTIGPGNQDCHRIHQVPTKAEQASSLHYGTQHRDQNSTAWKYACSSAYTALQE
jgi:hypothetical protein